eukprot:889552_1
MEDILLNSWEIQKEGVLEISSESESSEEQLDIYGRAIKQEDDNIDNDEKKHSIINVLKNKDTRYEIIFHRWVLLALCLLVPIICTVTVMVAIKKKQRCGFECLFALKGFGLVILS